MSVNVVQSADIDVSKFSFERRKSENSKQMTYNILYDGSSRTKFQIPKMFSPFGIKNTPEEYNKTNEDRYSNVFRLADESNPKNHARIQHFVKVLQDFDNHVAKFLEQNSKEIFGKAYTAEQILDDKYHSVIKKYVPKKEGDKVYPDSFKVKVPVYKDSGNAGFLAFNHEKKPIEIKKIAIQSDNKDEKIKYKVDLSEFAKPFESIPIIRCGSLLCLNKQIYVSFILDSFIMMPRKSMVITTDLFKMEPDYTEQLESKNVVSAGVSGGHEEEHIEEEEEEDEEEPVEEDDE